MESIYPGNIEENKLLFEFYDMMNHPTKDKDILGEWQIWIYGSDREAFPPHCHVRLSDGSIEFEVSLLNWEIVNIKHSKMPNSWDSIDNKLKKSFFEWLNRKPIEGESSVNKINLYTFWNGANPKNRLENWIDKKDGIDKDLLFYLGLDINCVQLQKTVIGHLSNIYFQDKNARHELHNLSPQDLLDAIGVNIQLKDNQEAIDIVICAEKNVYIWSENI